MIDVMMGEYDCIKIERLLPGFLKGPDRIIARIYENLQRT